MKQVFTNSQVAHVWAQQTQSTGRNASNSFWFRDDTIYSYNGGYVAAKIFTKRDKSRCVVINSDRYSNTTAKQLNDISSACRDLMPSFHLPCVTELKAKENIKHSLDRIESIWTSYEKKKKVDSPTWIKYALERVQDTIDSVNEYFAFIGKKPVSIDAKRVKALREHFAARFKRYNELNTPEAIAKKADIKFRKELAERIADRERQKELIADFRQGKNAFPRVSPQLLRIQGDEVVTSGGARVPLDEAKKALQWITSIKTNASNIKGLKIGHFEVSAIFDSMELPDDKIIQIGCHKIALSEAMAVLGGVK